MIFYLIITISAVLLTALIARRIYRPHVMGVRCSCGHDVESHRDARSLGHCKARIGYNGCSCRAFVTTDELGGILAEYRMKQIEQGLFP